MKFSIKDFFSKCDRIRSLTLTEEMLNRKLQFLCSANAIQEGINMRDFDKQSINQPSEISSTFPLMLLTYISGIFRLSQGKNLSAALDNQYWML